MNNEKINVLAFAAASGMLQRDFYVLEKKYGRVQTKTIVEWTELLKSDFNIPKIISTSSQEIENEITIESSEESITKSKEILKKLKQKSETEE